MNSNLLSNKKFAQIKQEIASHKRSTILGIIGVIVAAMLVEAAILAFLFQQNANSSSTLLLNQVVAILNSNNKDEKETIRTLKDQYIGRAQTLAYFFDINPNSMYDQNELGHFLELLQIDEIHILDSTGTIIAGTVPKYYGYSINSGKQMGYFKPMLKDKQLSMCQDATPNTAEGKTMMYAMTWNGGKTHMIEVGIEPIHLLEILKKNEITAVLDNIPTYNGMNIYVIDDEAGHIIGTSDKKLLGQKATDYGFNAKDIKSIKENDYSGRHSIINGKECYSIFEKVDGNMVVVTYSADADKNTFFVAMGVEAIYLIITGNIVCLILGKLQRSMAEGRKREEDLRSAGEELTAQFEEITALNDQLQISQAAAQQANDAKTSFLFNMSHDIRTPMNAIMGYIRLLKKNVDENGSTDKCNDYLHKIQSSSEFLLSLINNVLEMARIESGKATLEEKPMPVLEVCDSLVSVYSELMKNKNIEFTVKQDVQVSYINCDKVKTNEVFLNIVSNAYKYTPEGGKISLTLQELPNKEPGYVTLQTIVSDTGIGMSEEYLPTIFEEFTREHNATENKIQGTGLGMPIVKKLVDLMNGTITVESQLGNGSTFVVTIPYKIAETEEELSDENQATDDLTAFTEEFSGKRILLAEDNDFNAEIATEILSEAGFEVDWANDGKSCYEKVSAAEAGYYDLILMDIQMPNMNGYEATRAIRKLEDSAKARIPIIAMTANAFDEDKQDALNAGMNGHLAKPIDIAQLMQQLSDILGR